MTIAWTHRVELPAEPASVSKARWFVRSWLREHALAELEGDVQLVVSELATNAVLHAGTPFIVTVHGSDTRLVVLVQDGSPVHPALVTADPLTGAGRGVSIVDAVSQDWGSHDLPPAAKSVWAAFNLPVST